MIDGVRYSVPGDRARYLADGEIELLGRDSVTINSGGEKIFAEEVEQAIIAHPAVADVVVAGRPSPSAGARRWWPSCSWPTGPAATRRRAAGRGRHPRGPLQAAQGLRLPARRSCAPLGQGRLPLGQRAGPRSLIWWRTASPPGSTWSSVTSTRPTTRPSGPPSSWPFPGVGPGQLVGHHRPGRAPSSPWPSPTGPSWGVAETDDPSWHPAPLPGTTARLFARYPRPSQGILTGRPPPACLVVWIRPSPRTGPNRCGTGPTSSTSRKIAAAAVPGYTQITPYENTAGTHPRFMHFYEMDSDDPEATFQTMAEDLRVRLGGYRDPEFQAVGRLDGGRGRDHLRQHLPAPRFVGRPADVVGGRPRSDKLRRHGLRPRRQAPPHVTLITLNRPERMNAMAFDVMIPLREALESGRAWTTTPGSSCSPAPATASVRAPTRRTPGSSRTSTASPSPPSPCGPWSCSTTSSGPCAGCTSRSSAPSTGPPSAAASA